MLKDMKSVEKDRFGVLYLLSQEEPFRFKIRLQKLVVIARTDPKINYQFSFKFVSYYYGPYSKDLQNFLGLLVREGMLVEKTEETRGERESSKVFSYSLTENGWRYISEKMSTEEYQLLSSKINSLWERFGSWNTSSLIKHAKEISGMESVARNNS